MTQCHAFQRYFRENMEGLGLPVPNGLFNSYQSAIATAATLVGTLKTLGSGATMSELIGATIGLEKLAVAASIGAAFYVGAVIGSIAVASGRSLGCGSRLSDLFVMIEQHNLQFDGYTEFYRLNPQILDNSYSYRNSGSLRASTSPSSFEHS